jgi:hypothetical protein
MTALEHDMTKTGATHLFTSGASFPLRLILWRLSRDWKEGLPDSNGEDGVDGVGGGWVVVFDGRRGGRARGRGSAEAEMVVSPSHDVLFRTRAHLHALQAQEQEQEMST